MFKRTLLYLTRKKGKTATLFALISLITTFVLASFSLLYTTNDVAYQMRIAVGAQIHLRPTTTVTTDEIGTQNWEDNAIINEKMISQIIQQQQITSYNGSNSGHVSGLAFIPGWQATEDNNISRIITNHHSEQYADFTEGTLELIAGRHIVPDDENKIIISDRLALENNLEVGDTITLAPAVLGQTDDGDFTNILNDITINAQAEIIGIFQENEPQPNAELQPTAGLRINQIFTDHTLMHNLQLTKSGEYSSVTFNIHDPNNLDDVLSEIAQNDVIDWNDFHIQTNDIDYMRISDGLETIKNLITILLTVVSIVSAIILILILTMRMRARIHEVAILMSVGIPRKEISGQFITEIVLVALTAFAISNRIASVIVTHIQKEILINLQINIEEIDATLTSMPATMTLLIYLLVLTTLILTVWISILITVRLKPKEILTKVS